MDCVCPGPVPRVVHYQAGELDDLFGLHPGDPAEPHRVFRGDVVWTGCCPGCWHARPIGLPSPRGLPAQEPPECEWLTMPLTGSIEP